MGIFKTLEATVTVVNFIIYGISGRQEVPWPRSVDCRHPTWPSSEEKPSDTRVNTRCRASLAPFRAAVFLQNISAVHRFLWPPAFQVLVCESEGYSSGLLGMAFSHNVCSADLPSVSTLLPLTQLILLCRAQTGWGRQWRVLQSRSWYS